MFRVILCILFYRLMQLIFSTLLKGIIRKECQSFTNHGHDKTPPTVFNPLSLWLTLPRDMGVSHTLWPHSITRAILACLWFAQYDVQGDSMNSILSIDATYFFNITKKRCRNPWVTKIAQNVAVGMVPELLGGGNARRCRSSVPCCTLGRRRCTKVLPKRAVLHPRATKMYESVAQESRAAPSGDDKARKCCPSEPCCTLGRR